MVIKEYNYSEGAGGAGGGGLSELPWQPTVASTISDTGCDVQETGGGAGGGFVLNGTTPSSGRDKHTAARMPWLKVVQVIQM